MSAPTDAGSPTGRAGIGDTILTRTLRYTVGQIRYVRPVRPRGATGTVAQVYQQAEREFGLAAPPLALHSPVPELLAASWSILRETLVADGQLSRAAKEGIASAVSQSNSCPYCVVVHGATLRGLQSQAGAAGSDPAAEERLQRWAQASGDQRAMLAMAPPFAPECAPEAIGVALTFHYLNRMVSIYLPDSPLPPMLPPAGTAQAGRFLGRFMRELSARPHPPGASLALVESAELPDDLWWAAGSPAIAASFAAAAAVTDRLGAEYVSGPVRELVRDCLQQWDGADPGLDTSWLQRGLADLPTAERAAGRLALLTAFAPYRVDEATVADYRQAHPEDRSLIALTSWTAMSCARRIGSWIPLS
ncbi:MAG: carboxymuconolactone decarboxylase family protein [Jatrophihabitans sp.]